MFYPLCLTPHSRAHITLTLAEMWAKKLLGTYKQSHIPLAIRFVLMWGMLSTPPVTSSRKPLELPVSMKRYSNIYSYFLKSKYFFTPLHFRYSIESLSLPVVEVVFHRPVYDGHEQDSYCYTSCYINYIHDSIT